MFEGLLLLSLDDLYEEICNDAADVLSILDLTVNSLADLFLKLPRDRSALASFASLPSLAAYSSCRTRSQNSLS